MSATDFLFFVGGIAVSGALAALLLVLAPQWRLAGEGKLRAAIESALQPFIAHAIMAAYRLGESRVDAGSRNLSGATKKELADSTYRLLPDHLGGFDLTTVKSLVPQERFQVLVQDAFDRFDRYYLLHHAHFDAAFKHLQSQAVSPPPSEPHVPTE